MTCLLFTVRKYEPICITYRITASLHHLHMSGHRVRDEALLVRLVVQPVQVGVRRLLRPAERDLRMQLHARDRQLALSVFLEMTHRGVLVALEDKALVRGERQEG